MKITRRIVVSMVVFGMFGLLGCKTEQKANPANAPAAKTESKKEPVVSLEEEAKTSVLAMLQLVAGKVTYNERRSELLLEVAQGYGIKGDLERARKLFKDALKANYTPDTLGSSVVAEAKVGLLPEALKHYEALKKRGDAGDSPEQYMPELVGNAIVDGKETEVSALLASATPGQKLEIYAFAAQQLVENDKKKEALVNLNKAFALYAGGAECKGYSNTNVALLSAAVALKQLDAHLAEIEKLENEFPLGSLQLYADAKMSIEANRAAEKIKKDDYNNIRLWTEAAKLLHMVGNSEEANRILDECSKTVKKIRDKEEQVEAYARVAGSYFAMGDKKKSDTILYKAANSSPAFYEYEPQQVLGSFGRCDVQMANARINPGDADKLQILKNSVRSCAGAGELDGAEKMALATLEEMKSGKIEGDKFGVIESFIYTLASNGAYSAAMNIIKSELDPTHEMSRRAYSEALVHYLGSTDSKETGTSEEKALLAQMASLLSL